MKRRAFILAIGGAAASSVSWPLATRAQQPALPVVGFVRSTSRATSAHLVTSFRRGLKEAGYVEGQNLTVGYRWADDHADRTPGAGGGFDTPENRCGRRQSHVSLCVQSRNHHDTDCVHNRKRSGQRRPCRQLQPARWQPHGRGLFLRRAGDETVGAVPSARAQGDNNRCAGQLEKSWKRTRATQRRRPRRERPDCKPLSSTPAALPRSSLPLRHWSNARVGAVFVGSGAFLFSNLGPAGRVGGSSRHADELSAAGVCRGRRPDELRRQYDRILSPSRVIRRTDLKGEKAADVPVMRSTKFEFVPQSQDCQDARSRLFRRLCSRLPTR